VGDFLGTALLCEASDVADDAKNLGLRGESRSGSRVVTGAVRRMRSSVRSCPRVRSVCSAAYPAAQAGQHAVRRGQRPRQVRCVSPTHQGERLFLDQVLLLLDGLHELPPLADVTPERAPVDTQRDQRPPLVALKEADGGEGEGLADERCQDQGEQQDDENSLRFGGEGDDGAPNRSHPATEVGSAARSCQPASLREARH
jgi:hypothetical protein